MSPRDKPLVWLRGDVKTPPFGIATDGIVILDVFKKQTEATPKAVITACQERLGEFRRLAETMKGADRARR